ncbi:MAG TPA: protein kinase, partial [Polyangiaceae bacterium]
EARAVARVSHEALVRLYDFGFTSEGKPFYAMELVAGETLEARLERRGPASASEAVELGIGACRAIEAVHAAGFVHRDVKPGNLMLTDGGGVKLLDFGIAKFENEVSFKDESDGGAFVVVGTPEYMAPEQARGAADARSDVYALGAVIYELVTGALPHEAPSLAALLDRKLAGAPAPASALAPSQPIPKALDRLLERALAPEPSARFQTASELREALETLAGGRASRRTLRRGVGYAAFGAVTFVAMAILGASMSGATAANWADHGRLLKGSVSALFASTKAVPAKATPAPAPESPPVATPVATTEPVATAAPEPAGVPSAPSEAPDAAPVGAPAEGPEEGPAAQALAEFEGLRANGRALKALHVIRKAAAELPREPAVLRAYVRAAQESKAWGEARRAALRWVELDPSTEARLALARLERATGNTARAFALLTQLEREDPKSDEVRRLLALLPTDQKLALNR